MAKPYAYICSTCRHPLSGHRLVPGDTDVVTGPYQCRYGSCGCRVCQSSPRFGVNEAEFKKLYPDWPEELRLTSVS